MPGCSAKRCGKNSSKKDQVDEKGNKITFHQFPTNKERKELWIRRVRDGGKGNQWAPKPNAKLCSLHFEDKYIERSVTANNRPLTKLNEDAEPTIFNWKPKNGKAGKVARISPSVSPVMSETRRSLRIAANPDKIDNYARLVKDLAIEDSNPDLVDSTDDDAILTSLFSQVDGKMVTIPTNEGVDCKVFVCKMAGDVLLNTSTQDSVPAPPLLPTTPVPLPEEWDSTSAPPAPSAKFVSRSGAQPFSDDHEVESSSDDDLNKAGPSCSSDDDAACCSSYNTDFCDPYYGATENSEKVEGTPGHHLQQALELLQSLQISLMAEMPPERLTNLSSLMEQLSIEGNTLLREQAIIRDQISAYKRLNPNVLESDSGKRVKAPDSDALFSGYDLQSGLSEEESEALNYQLADTIDPIEPSFVPLSPEDYDAILLTLQRDL